MQVIVEDVEEVFEKNITSSATNTRICFPKEYKGKKVKILVLADTKGVRKK